MAKTAEVIVIGEVPEVEGLYLACGFSGHGFMHSPAVGRYLVELILTEENISLDASCLSLQRFQQQDYQPEKLFV